MKVKEKRIAEEEGEKKPKFPLFLFALFLL
jgi:hypothetical protein